MSSIWMLIAGIVVFLLGIGFMEEVLRKSAGRSFKLFVRKHTAKKWKAVGGGVLITALLQGSSSVNMMVLAFTGSGVLPLENALAIILGSNLGTTIDSWLIATLGFTSLSSSLPYAITGISGIGMYLVRSDSNRESVFRFFLGVGLLFVGLDLMQGSMDGVIRSTMLQRTTHLPLGMFAFAGIVITSLIQSSFAMVALALSALYAGALGFEQAAALVLGAEVGTTLKFFIASLDGHPVKKRLALGNFMINLVTFLIVLIFLRPILQLIRETPGLGNALLALVAFQTLVNIISIVCFLPVIGRFAFFLGKQYTNKSDETLFIQKIPPSESVLALDAMENETRHMLQHVILYIMESFGIEKDAIGRSHTILGTGGKSLQGQYAYIKRLHGDIHYYYLRIRKELSGTADNDRLDRLMSSVRNGMYAAKNMKDAYDDVVTLRNSSNDMKYGYYEKCKVRTEVFCIRMYGLISDVASGGEFDVLMEAYREMVKGYTEELSGLYRISAPISFTETEISTIVNFNRELYTSYKSLLLALKDFILDKASAEQFDELPGFIR